MTTFDEAACKRIEAAVAQAEAKSAGEIVVASAPSSDRYDDVRWFFVTALTLSLGALAHWLHPAWPTSSVLLLQLAVAAASFVTLGFAPLLRALVPRDRLDQAVQQSAREAFFEHELFATRDRSGVLIFVSELEHRVVILGDAGIHACMPQGAWQAHVNRIASGFREGTQADAVCKVIDEVGELLARHFEPRHDDDNELDNAMRKPRA